MSKKMSLEQWLAINGVSSPISDYTIDKTKIPRGLTQRERKRCSWNRRLSYKKK